MNNDSIKMATTDKESTTPAATPINSHIRMFPQDVQFGPDGLFSYLVPRTDGKPQTTLNLAQPVAIKIQDVRMFPTNEDRIKAGFNLETTTFEIFEGFGKQSTAKALQDGKYLDPDWIVNDYYQDVLQLLEKRLNVKGLRLKLTILGHRTRQRTDPADTEQQASSAKVKIGGPNNIAHVDNSMYEGLKLVEELHGPEAVERLCLASKKDNSSPLLPRALIINTWRLFRDNQVNDWPLAMVDARTLDASDLVSGHLHNDAPPQENGRYVVQGRPMGFYGVKHRESVENGDVQAQVETPGVQEWWYLSQQKTQEALMMRIWDSSDPTHPCVHGSFKHPDTPEDLSEDDMRKSIEVRVLVYIEAAE